MATMAEVVEVLEEIKRVRSEDKTKAVELFIALVRKQSFPVDTIVLHYAFHIEECAAVVFYKKWGEKFFSGISNAVVEIWSEGRMLQEYSEQGFSDLDLLIQKKTLLVGAANSLTDEHGTRWPSAAHLAVELLGMAGNPLFRQLLAFYESTDNRPNSTFFDFHSFTKRAHVFNKKMSKGLDEENKAMQNLLGQMMYAVEVDLWDQMRFLEAEAEFKSWGKICRWVNSAYPKDRLDIVTVQSDNHAMGRQVRRLFGGPPDVYVQQNSEKGTVVFFSPKFLNRMKLSGVDIRDFVRVLRIFELKASGMIFDRLSENWLFFDNRGRIQLCLDWKEIEAPLDSELCPPWYHSTKGDQLLSRSLTAPEAPETKLNFEQIAQAIALALTPMLYPCKMDECGDNACRFYRLGFVACRRKRYEINNSSLIATGTNGG